MYYVWFSKLAMDVFKIICNIKFDYIYNMINQWRIETIDIRSAHINSDHPSTF
jgi:hypothetical protein